MKKIKESVLNDRSKGNLKDTYLQELQQIIKHNRPAIIMKSEVNKLCSELEKDICRYRMNELKSMLSIVPDLEEKVVSDTNLLHILQENVKKLETQVTAERQERQKG